MSDAWTAGHEMTPARIDTWFRQQSDEQIAVLEAHNVWYGPPHLRPRPPAPREATPEPKPEPEAPPVRVSASHIIAMCAERAQVSVAALVGKGQTKDIATHRHVAAYLVRKYRKLSFNDTARRLGRDHSTTMAAIRKVETDLDNGGNRFGPVVKDVEKRLGLST